MKEIIVNNQVIQLNVSGNAQLTPKLVKRAMRIAFGSGQVAAVVRDKVRGYFVYAGGSIRKMTAEEEFDCNIGEN